MKGKYRPPTREQQQTFEAWYKAYMEKKRQEGNPWVSDGYGNNQNELKM